MTGTAPLSPVADSRLRDGKPRAVGARRPLWPWLMGLFIFAVNASNLRLVTPGDNIPAALMPLALVRGDGVYLDRFESQLRAPDAHHELVYYVIERDGHLLSVYPLGSGLVAAPFMVPAILALDWLDPGWSEKPGAEMGASLWISKFASAAIAGLIAIALSFLLRALGLRSVAPFTVLAASLGSNLWMIAGQTLWQHGPATLMLILSMLLLSGEKRSRIQLVLAGIATSGIVWCRPPMLIFAAAIALWVVWHERARAGWFAAPAVALAGLMLAYNVSFFAHAMGGNIALETPELHMEQHGVASAWSSTPLTGLLGTLVSPSHGLLIFTPWVALAVALLPASGSALARGSLARWMLWSLVPLAALNSLYAPWWAGHCFGPRYWTEAMPLFAIMLGLAIEWSRGRNPGWRIALVATILFSIGIQAIGAVCYPSSWCTTPVEVDLHHERLWDWRDSELTRCLREGPRPIWTICW